MKYTFSGPAKFHGETVVEADNEAMARHLAMTKRWGTKPAAWGLGLWEGRGLYLVSTQP